MPINSPNKGTVLTALIWLIAASLSEAAVTSRPPEQEQRGLSPMLTNTIERPLRYYPDGTDFVITNGGEFFNRPLYGGNTGFRVDAGDMPEFSLYLPGRGGNLRLGVRHGPTTKWLHEMDQIVARYRPGSMLYKIRDAMLGNGVLHLTALATRAEEGFMVRAELDGAVPGTELIWGFGGVSGERGRRGGDIGCESVPVRQFFWLRPEQCKGNRVTVTSNTFTIVGQRGAVAGVASEGAILLIGDADQWANAGGLLENSGQNVELPVVVGRTRLRAGEPQFLMLQRVNPEGNAATATLESDALSEHFAAEEQRRRAIADQVVVDTPDSFINAAAAALNVAADAVWDEGQSGFMHGAVAWRRRLLGWRGVYAGDALGWHDRTRRHIDVFAARQNTNPIPDKLPPADSDTNLSRSENALHSNGDLTKSHYDMNLVAMDAMFRHLLWTADLDWARKMWPVLERHLAWERRLFRRPFGTDGLPLYEGYAAIWASDDVAYNGGGAAHASAYNYYHNKMAARIARMIGKNPDPYEREAALIAKAMHRELWLPKRGRFAEYKDLLGLQLIHPDAAAWTFYHTVDSEVPTAFEAWEMTEDIATRLPRIPVRGPGVPRGNFTISTTRWMPYSWSVNNVVMAESMHTALACWQANREEVAFPLFKGAVLDSMYLGLCPGNVGMCTFYDCYRRESQRDFADGIGVSSRALVEGLFGVKPDALAGELVVRPGFPVEWDHASMRHPDFTIHFQRDGDRETFTVESRFAKPMALRLQVAALRDDLAGVTVNGKPAPWHVLDDSVGLPRVEIQAQAAPKLEVVVKWRGDAPVETTELTTTKAGGEVNAGFGAASVTDLADPQRVLNDVKRRDHGFLAKAVGLPGHRTVFAKLKQGRLTWWQPVTFEIRAALETGIPVNWTKPVKTQFDTVDLSSVFNDQVTQIFQNEYLSPRSPYCSLATPKQGIGAWCHPKDEFVVDDSGLRTAAAKVGDRIVLPNGVPFATPGKPDAKNIIFTSQWDNYPSEVTIPLSGKSSHAYLLMAGSTGAMQSRLDNGEVVVTYADRSSARLPLRNPTTWWPIDQDYFIDDFAFRRPEPIPPRVDLKTGKVRLPDATTFKGKGGKVEGGAATVLDLPLDSSKQLKSVTVRALANEVVIGLMSVTLERE